MAKNQRVEVLFSAPQLDLVRSAAGEESLSSFIRNTMLGHCSRMQPEQFLINQQSTDRIAKAIAKAIFGGQDAGRQL